MASLEGGLDDRSAENGIGPAQRDDAISAKGRAEVGPLRLSFFGHDACESTVIKRARGLRAAGADVLGVMFRRERKPGLRQVDCEVVDLGTTVDRNYLARVPKLAAALGTLWKHRQQLRNSEAFYARNIDMLLLALCARAISGSRGIVAYEVLDVQRVFLREDLTGRFFRWVERRAMAGVSLLVVSSPDFISQYFAPMQKYAGAHFLLENKICPHQLPENFAFDGQPCAATGPPWRIGWFGTLRCKRSLGLLADIAERLGPRVEIDLRGIPSHEDLSEADIAMVCDRLGNMTYHGAFSSPRDLPDIYGRVHFAWSFDYLDAGTNSDWLLPNRVYEGTAFGAVCLAREGTMTGRYVSERRIGITFGEPVADQVVSLLEGLDIEGYARLSEGLRNRHASDYLDLTDTADLISKLRDTHQAREDRAST